MSGRKNRFRAFNIFSAQSMGASASSSVTNIQGLDNIGIQAVWTGTPVGTLTVEVSADYAQDINGNVTNAGTWTALPISQAAGGASGNVYFDITGISAPWIRLTYTRTSSTGSLTATITGKML